MSEDWYDLAYINFDEVILHGRRKSGVDEFGVSIERDVRVVLSSEQWEAVERLSSRHQTEMQNLLRGMAA